MYILAGEPGLSILPPTALLTMCVNNMYICIYAPMRYLVYYIYLPPIPFLSFALFLTLHIDKTSRSRMARSMRERILCIPDASPLYHNMPVKSQRSPRVLIAF